MSSTRRAASGTLVLAILLGPFGAAGQTPGGSSPQRADATHRITLHGGTIHFGRVLDEGDPLRLETYDGEIVEIPHARIAKRETVRGTFEEGEFWPTDPNGSRLLFGPTGRSLPAGSGSFNAYYGILPFLAVGLTDRLTFAAGTPLFFGGGDGRIYYFAPKLQVVRGEALQAGVGLLALHFPEEENDYLAYGVATWEPERYSSFTLGVGWGRSEGGWTDRPAILLGADHRGSRRTRLITENYVFPGGGGIVSAGVRFLGERLSADLALATPIDEHGGFVFPVVNFSYGW